MRILIIDDEARIAARIERFVRELLGSSLTSLARCDSIELGIEHIRRYGIDLLFLDLNLNGQDGFDVLKSVVAESFHTIVVSAYTDKAITAFEYGVLDFIGKPFAIERVKQALDRVSLKSATLQSPLKFLAVKTRGQIRLIPVEDVLFVKGAGVYAELHLHNGSKALHDKTLEKLAQLLPDSFDRIHKSYLADSRYFAGIHIQSGGRYTLQLTNGQQLPIGRSRYEQLKQYFH
ncbi:LytTR family DNA-binding domain-containing protein [Spirosoma terrae]|uniref:Response regulator transcription factor n=1 Tax=Spirosoma terrae TaxID=1968276 RepID=A0A6L9LIY6_9BACT|nr:LytTR family DNA-binding domain-containing protein [Spirosoma terrae]NDU99211.1 response regulator transcription factor [Spirosoma terrae]